MMRLATAAALLMVFVATPALAIVCERRCAEPVAHTGRASDASHSHHHTGPQSSDFGLQSSVLKTGPEHACVSHVHSELGAPERPSAFAAAELATSWAGILEPLAALTRAAGLDEIRPPPLESRATTPLRI
jgi:hypothetical protein